MTPPIRLALFASGSGSNVENFVHYFRHHSSIEVAQVYCNNPQALVIERCQRLGIPCLVFDRNDFYQSTRVLDHLRQNGIQCIVLAGFLWLVPKPLIEAFTSRIINIHPALLPKYGGAGMYGAHVHKAIVAAGERETGITIHLVNEEYDKGRILFQARCSVLPEHSPEQVAHHVHELEYRHFPAEVEKYLMKGT